MFDVIIIGGGAAGFYTAIHLAENASHLKIAILERGKDVLAKVKISGGGRCNVAHAEFDPSDLAKNYPRGEKELLGPFHTYCTGDVMAFFEERGIPLKIEEDGRIFPVSNSSQTIIDCFVSEAKRLGVQVLKHSSVSSINYIDNKNPDAGWNIVSIKKAYQAKKVVVATGSNPKIWKMMEDLGHTIVPPVPSLFTFNIKDDRIKGIAGVSTNARVEIFAKSFIKDKLAIKLQSDIQKKPILESEGPLLITHWGMSGPAILKLSAWGANELHNRGYKFKIRVNWLPDMNQGAVMNYLLEVREVEVKKTILRTKAVDVPRRLWTNMVNASGISATTKWADISKIQLQELVKQLTESEFFVSGKSTFKEEFVTAGGIELKEVDFKTYESKIATNLFFAGEVLNIDAITGGFNFQNAWTGGFIVAKAISNESK